jgi:hypothetical protein
MFRPIGSRELVKNVIIFSDPCLEPKPARDFRWEGLHGSFEFRRAPNPASFFWENRQEEPYVIFHWNQSDRHESLDIVMKVTRRKPRNSVSGGEFPSGDDHCECMKSTHK